MIADMLSTLMTMKVVLNLLPRMNGGDQ